MACDRSAKNLATCVPLLIAMIVIGSVDFAAAQPAGTGMAMSANTLFLAQLDAKQVAGESSSSATGTGAFVIDSMQRTLAYTLTYAGLEAGGAKSIALHNFGRGKSGRTIETLCGAGAAACPKSGSATIAGRIERGDTVTLDNKLIGEFDSERVYVEVIGGNGKPEIRGQLGPNSAMVKVANFTVHLAPLAGSDAKGSGTAVVSETYLPAGKVSVFYALTVAGTSGAPTNAAFVTDPALPGAAFTARMALPQIQPHASTETATGGTLSGSYDVNSVAPDALFASRILSTGNRKAGLVVTTGRFPRGELYGALVPVP